MNTEINTLTQELVNIPSVTEDQETCRLALEHARNYLEMDPVVYNHNGVLSYLWGDRENIMTPRLLLSGHLDVVSADAGMFRSRVEEGKLYGRGAGDMKGHVASMLYAYKEALETDRATGIGLLLTTDEEMGGFNGTRHVVEQGLRPDVVFIPDGLFDFDIVKSQKAPHHFTIRATSQGGHASRAHLLDNPINRIFKVYSQMQGLYDLATPEDDWRSTFAMTVVGTENQSKNRIPSEATAAFSWRWPPEQHDFEEGRAHMKKFCGEQNCEIIEEEGGGEGCLTDPEAGFVKEWKTTVEGVIGREVGFENTHGASDGRHFYHAKNGGTKKVLVTSAISEGHHASNENVDLESLGQLAEAIGQYIRKV